MLAFSASLVARIQAHDLGSANRMSLDSGASEGKIQDLEK